MIGVRAGTKTSSPVLQPRASRETWRPEVQELIVIECLVL